MKKINLKPLLALLAFLLLGNANVQAATEYGIYVAETMITSNNANDVLGNGQFRYTPSTKTLTVTNAKLTNNGSLGSGISNRTVDGLIIKFVGTSTFNTRMDVINSSTSLSITGTGSLTGTSTEGYGLSFTGTSMTCTIDGPTLSLASNAYGLSDYRSGTTLKIQGNGTRLALTPGSGYITIRTLKNLSLASGYYVTEPAGGYYSSSLKSITTDGSTSYRGKVVFSTNPADYELYIGKTSVTSANANDILGNGQFSYDPSTKTLTLTNANYTNTAAGGEGISNLNIDNLNIKLVGNNSITSQSWVISSTRSFSFTGTGSLTATSTNNGAMCLWSRWENDINCTINGPQLTVVSPSTYSICGSSAYKSTVTVIGSTTRLDIQPKESYEPLFLIDGFTVGSGLYFTQPYGAYYDMTLKDITTDGKKTYKGRVIVSSQPPEEPVAPTDYGFYIGEERVTSAYTSGELGSGSFNYDPATNTLTLHNAVLTNEGAMGNGIDIRENVGLNIRLIGYNVINTRNSPFASERSFSITGTGMLSATSSQSGGMQLWGANMTCTIDGPTIQLTGNTYAIYDDYIGTAKVVIKSGDVTLQSAYPDEYPIIKGLAALELVEPMRIKEPAGAYFDPNLKSLTTDGVTAYMGKVRFIAYSEYELWVAGTQVTSFNEEDVLGDGTVQHNSGQLYLNNAKLSGGIVKKGGNMFNIHFYGDCEINDPTCGIDYQDGRLLYLSGSRDNFGGKGTMTINVPDGKGIALGMNTECVLRLGIDATINAAVAIQGDNTPDAAGVASVGSMLTFMDDTARLRMETTVAAIAGISTLNMDGLYITIPYGAWYDQQLQTITTDGVTPCTTVVISSDEPVSDYFSEDTDKGLRMNFHVTDENSCEVVGTESMVGGVATNVEIPETAEQFTVTGIAAEAFRDYASLANVWMPRTIRTIGYAAFFNCGNLANVYLKSQKPPILLNENGEPTDDNDAFAGVASENASRALSSVGGNLQSPTLHVPYGSLKAYDKAPWNKWFASIVADASMQGDVNGDFIVDVADIATVISVMASSTEPQSGASNPADVNGDGIVDVADIATVISIMAANARQLQDD